MKVKKRKLLTSLAFVSVLLLAGCQKDDYVEIVGLCPVVLSTSPLSGSTNTALGDIITVTFNEKMNPSTINTASFSLKNSIVIAGTITYSGNTATFTPSTALLPNTTYTGRVTTAVKSEKGNALQTDYVWSFSTFQ